MSKIAKQLTELVGNTPLLELNKYSQAKGLETPVIAKVEFFNPGGSVKDRIALAMIEDAEERGLLKPGATIIEPTSGNTGVGLALVSAVKGYRLILTMPETMSVERRNLVKAYGAEVRLTSGKDGMPGAIRAAEELRDSIPGSVILQQFENAANPAKHYATTGPEIWRDTDGQVDIFQDRIGRPVGEVAGSDLNDWRKGRHQGAFSFGGRRETLELVGAVVVELGIVCGGFAEGVILPLVQEAGEFGNPLEFNRAGRAVPLLSDDDFGLSLQILVIRLVIPAVILFTVNKHHNVGILFNGTRVAQIAQAGAVVFRLFGLAVDLRQTEDRNVEIPCQSFQAARRFGDLLLPRFQGVVRLDVGQIVDDDQAQPVLPLEPPRHRRDFRNGVRRGVVNEEEGVGQITVCLIDA